MDSSERADYPTLLYALLRIALNTSRDIPPELSALSDFRPEDWDGLISSARHQAVSGLVYDAISSLSPILSLKIPKETGAALMIETDAIVRKNKTVSLLAEQVLDMLKENKATVMKGPAVGAFYPHPEFRSPGDLDLFCPIGRPDRILSTLQQKLDPGSREPVHRVKGDDSWHCKIRGIDIDLHRHYFDFETPGRTYPAVSSPDATLLMLSSHILKHAIGPGVGLRQICDLAMAYRSLSGQYDWTELCRTFRSHNLLKWNLLSGHFIQMRLGVSPGGEEMPSPDISPLEHIVLSGGNFGHFNASRTFALSRNRIYRKSDTLLRFIRNMPFGLRYAPEQYCSYVSSLVKGNLR